MAPRAGNELRRPAGSAALGLRSSKGARMWCTRRGMCGLLVAFAATLLAPTCHAVEPVEFDSLTLTVEGPIDILPGLRNARVHGRAVNRGKSFVVNVVAKPEVVAPSGEVTSI